MEGDIHRKLAYGLEGPLGQTNGGPIDVEAGSLEAVGNIHVTDRAKEAQAEEGYDPDFGARPLRRVIQHRIEDALSEGILGENYSHGDLVEGDVDEAGKIIFRTVESQEEPEAPMPEFL